MNVIFMNIQTITTGAAQNIPPDKIILFHDYSSLEFKNHNRDIKKLFDFQS